MVSLCQLFFFPRIIPKFRSFLVLQILTHAQQSRESSNHEQVSLIEKILEYKRQNDIESRETLNSSHVSTNGDSMQPFAWRSHKEIEAVMQSTTKGKVFVVPILLNLRFRPRVALILHCLQGTNNSTRISFEALLQFEG